jgi:hypothetical protein
MGIAEDFIFLNFYRFLLLFSKPKGDSQWVGEWWWWSIRPTQYPPTHWYSGVSVVNYNKRTTIPVRRR